MELHDVHAHLTDRRLAQREVAVVARARSAGVSTIVANGLDPEDNARVLELGQRYPDLVRPAVGLYPVHAVLLEMLEMGVEYHTTKPPVPAAEALDWLRAHVDECFAVGEVGLDRHWVPRPLWEKQEAVFREVVALALEADKVLIVHTRKAESRAFEVLCELGARRVVWHCFSGNLKLARRIAGRGHYLSIPANVRKAQHFAQMLRTLPRDRLLLETDCPYLGPVRGELNEPANVAVTAAYAAEVWECRPEEAHGQFATNFSNLFGRVP